MDCGFGGAERAQEARGGPGAVEGRRGVAQAAVQSTPSANWELPSSLEVSLTGAGMGCLFVFTDIVHPIYFASRGAMLFLPLMLTSVVCAGGIAHCWICSTVALLNDTCRHH